MRLAIVGVEPKHDGDWKTLRDWEVLERLNNIRTKEKAQSVPKTHTEAMTEFVEKASGVIAAEIEGFNFPFRIPEHKAIALIWSPVESTH